jgi:Tfp pilus assembly protein PilN
VQSRALKKELKLSEQETVEMLKDRFSNIPEDEDDLETIKETAESELKKEEEIWYAFTRQARASFLEYLLELSSRINKSELGFIPEQLTIVDGQEGQITLKARVRDFEALKKLEQVLRESKLFSYVEGQTSPDFTMKILVGKPEGK